MFVQARWWNIPNQSQPNPGLPGDVSPCKLWQIAYCDTIAILQQYHNIRYHSTVLPTRNPIVFEDAVDADVAVTRDVGVEYAREEADLWRVEGVVERHLQVEQGSLIYN